MLGEGGEFLRSAAAVQKRRIFPLNNRTPRRFAAIAMKRTLIGTVAQAVLPIA
ncbi:MAG: hypothetical protein K6T86_15640 [Pirellulales bacterium]|nr:hypothetical protein [Pirellulales bacterium]